MHARSKDIVERATAYVGTRYRDQGRNSAGLDCAGLLVVVARDLGISSFDTADYGRRPNVEEFTRHMLSAGCKRLRHGDRHNGDILRMSLERWPVHVGVYELDDSGAEWFIHAYLPLKQVVRERLDRRLSDAVSTTWRFPE